MSRIRRKRMTQKHDDMHTPKVKKRSNRLLFFFCSSFLVVNSSLWAVSAALWVLSISFCCRWCSSFSDWAAAMASSALLHSSSLSLVTWLKFSVRVSFWLVSSPEGVEFIHDWLSHGTRLGLNNVIATYNEIKGIIWQLSPLPSLAPPTNPLLSLSLKKKKKEATKSSEK